MPQNKKNTGAVFSPEDLFQGYIPPQAVDFEEIVLGTIMQYPQALHEVIDILTPEVFYKSSHQLIYESIQGLFSDNKPVDLSTVMHQLKKSKQLEEVGGAYELAKISGKAKHGSVEYHARILIEKKIGRELIRISHESSKQAFDPSVDIFNILNTLQDNLITIEKNIFKRDYVRIDEGLSSAVSTIQERAKEGKKLSGIPTSFTELDSITGGFQNTDLIILAARPGMGKTSLAVTMARNMAVNHHKTVAMFSLEMAAEQIFIRILSAESSVSSGKLKNGDVEEEDWQKINKSLNSLSDAPILVDDTPALSVFDLRAKCLRIKERVGLDCIFVDYIQLMTAGAIGRQRNREQEISTISRTLKAIAKELKIPVIALSQLSRDVEKRGGAKIPVLSDLRESGAIEQDADIVMFVYRPEYYGVPEDETGKSTENEAILRIAKHRNGALKDVNLKFIPEFAQFTNPDPEYGYMDPADTNNLPPVPPNMEFDVTEGDDLPF